MCVGVLLDDMITPPGFKILGDSAFPHRGQYESKIWTPLTEAERRRLREDERAAAEARSAAITSIRQSAEWGMRSIKSKFPRISCVPLPVDDTFRSLLCQTIVLFYNFKVSRIGLNQIEAVFE